MSLRALLAGLVLAGGAAAGSRGEAMTSEQLLRAQAITLQVGTIDLRPDAFSPEALLAAVAQDAARHDAPGLPPELAAERLDPARVSAFVSGLTRLPPASLALIAGRTVRLNLPALRLHVWSPTSAAQLAHGFDLAPGGNAANPHLADVHLLAPIDEAGSVARLTAARRFAEDRTRPAPARRSAAIVWRALADTLAAAHLSADWQEQEVAARRVLDGLAVAPSGGMPRPRR